jgi:hypothetical protein
MQTEATEKGEGATVQAARPIIIETPIVKNIAPVIDAESWVTPQDIHIPTISTRCGDIGVSRYENDHDTPVLLSFGSGGCVNVMIHISDADALAIRNALNIIIGG